MHNSKQWIVSPKMPDDFLEFQESYEKKFGNLKNKCDHEIMQKFIKSPWNDPDRAMGGKVSDDIYEAIDDDADLLTNTTQDWYPRTPLWGSITLKKGTKVLVYIRAPGAVPGWYNHYLKSDQNFCEKDMATPSSLGLLRGETLELLRREKWIAFHTDRVDYPLIVFSFWERAGSFPLYGNQGVMALNDLDSAKTSYCPFPGINPSPFSLPMDARNKLHQEFIEQKAGFDGLIQQSS